MRALLHVLLAIAIGIVSTAGLASSFASDDLVATYGDEEFLSLATGSRQPLARVPAVASVITSADLEATGAIDLSDALETIPGLHVGVAGGGYNPIYIFRGIYSELNPQALLLINGIPLTNVFFGNRGQGWGGMPVQNIARIEIVRGPGSALYGADAFSGAINVITKTSADLRGFQAGVRAGSFRTGDAWLQYGGEWLGLNAAFSLEIGTTDGQRRQISGDAQTRFDQLFGTSVSLAPGPVNVGRDSIEARLDLSKGNWRLRAGYQGRRNGGTAAGAAEALDPRGRGESDRFNVDLTYQNPVFARDWDLTAQVSYLDTSTKTSLVLYPPGAFNTVFGDAFANGVLGNPDVYERHLRANISAFYTGFDRHRIRVGTGVQRADMYKVRESKNYTILPNGLIAPLGGLLDVTDTAPFIRPHVRDVSFIFIQDEWNFSPDWNLTAGVRYDNYSDFGSTVNPRLALVWQADYNLTAKLLAGRAFRPPSFAEQFNINNPFAVGNSNLYPETINTYELAFNYQPTGTLQTNLSLFRYKMSDILRFVADPPPATTRTAQNSGSQTGYGLEWEVKWDVTKKLRLSGNYAFQRSTDELTGQDAGNAPRNHIYMRADWKFDPQWTLDTQVNWIADRKRVAGDTRPPVDDYTTVDFVLRGKKLWKDWDASLILRNAFDADAREPSPSPGLIPNDLPLPGRAWYLQLQHRL